MPPQIFIVFMVKTFKIPSSRFLKYIYTTVNILHSRTYYSYVTYLCPSLLPSYLLQLVVTTILLSMAMRSVF